ncbi:MAG: endonuclease [Firmicutes bacterium]|nr:endonuclease [Bacillota bacterium]
MKKLLFILSIILLATTLFSCTESTNYTIDRVLDRVDVIYAEGDDVFSVTTHVTLPDRTDLNKSASLSWVSDKPLVLDEFGTVNRPDETTEVTLTLTVTLDGETREKNIYLMVVGIYQYYTVTFEADEVSYGSIKVKDGDKVEPIADPVITGSSFKGWFISEDDVNAFDFDTPITDNIKLIAKLDVLVLADYHIEYYYQNLADDAYTLVETETLNGEVGTEIDATNEITGYSIDAEQSVLTGTIAENDTLVLKVYYERNLYTIQFMSDGVELQSNELKFGAPLSAITNPSKEDHVFLGWSITNNGTTPYVFSTTVDSSITFYAIWQYGVEYTGYYASINGVTDANLKTALRMLISQMTTLVYSNTSNMLNVSDRDPSNPNNVILVYNRQSVNRTWDGGSTWNKEHVWPQSKLGTASASDIHNLKPANPVVNSTRGNLPFAQGTNSFGTVSGGYFPGHQDKGDIARIVFYMHVRWNLIINTSTVGDLDMLLRWHIEDPVDDFERNRNDLLYGYQNNRNPFIDHPEFAERIWGPITLTASNQETYTVDIDFTSMFDDIDFSNYDIIYVEFKKESQYLM